MTEMNDRWSRSPHNIDDESWWYAEPDGIHILSNKSRNESDPTIGVIPWRQIRTALRKKDNSAGRE